MNIATHQDKLYVILGLCRGLPFGAIAELGVWHGGTLKLMVDQFTDDRMAYGFDTFTGIPGEQLQQQERKLKGWFSDASLESVRNEFKAYPNVQIIKGLFPNTITDEHRNATYSIVHLDADIYVPIRAGIEFFWPRIVPGGVIVIDDYKCPECPLVEVAIKHSGLVVEPTAKWQCIARKSS